MGRQAILYGRIQEDWEGTDVPWPVVPQYNRTVLDRLPDTDDCWPFLTRHLFAVPTRPPAPAAYRGSVIHFGASLKDDANEPGWPELFAAKFEEFVLKPLIWTSATIHFESSYFPARGYLYRVDGESQREQYYALSLCRYDERLAAGAQWARRGLGGAEGRPNWLH